jgi:hypothetical protein
MNKFILIFLFSRAGYLILNTLFSTIFLCTLFFSLLTIAERTLNQVNLAKYIFKFSKIVTIRF